MSREFLDKDGLTYLWGKIKAYVDNAISSVPGQCAEPYRVVVYMNQFYAGIGGESVADIPPDKSDGKVGAANAIDNALGSAATVVGTIWCGDDYIANNESSAISTLVGYIQDYDADILICSPCFAAGKFGNASVLLADACQTNYGIKAIMAAWPTNSAIPDYVDRLHIVKTTSSSASGMNKSAQLLAKNALKYLRGIGPLDGDCISAADITG